MNRLKYDIRRGADTYRSIYHSRLKSWILKGIIKPDEALVWRSGLSGWRRPEELEELAPYFQQQEEEHLKRERVEASPHLFSKKVIKSILIIDDEEDLCWLLSNILESKGYQVSTANTISEGMARLGDAPDLLFLDLKLPDGDGMDMLPRIRGAAPQALVVIISAYGSEKKKGTAIDAGVCSFLDKPFTAEQVLETIEQLSSPLPGQAGDQCDPYSKLRNRWKQDHYLTIASGILECAPVEQDWYSAEWIIERIQGTVYSRIRSRVKQDHYLTIASGILECAPVEQDWYSAEWIIERIQGTVYSRIRSRVKQDRCINTGPGAPECASVGLDWHSAQWTIE
jgi:CheY-like chemotaxis protein